MRAVLTVSPNNPTGSYLGRRELTALTALGLPIVSDEVFAYFAFGEDARRVASLAETWSGLTSKYRPDSRLTRCARTRRVLGI